jgi:hypothetical protein
MIALFSRRFVRRSSVLVVAVCSAVAGCGGSTSSASGADPTPIVAQGDYGAACLSAMRSSCPAALDACQADRECASLTNGCINDPPLPYMGGSAECESAAQGGTPATAVFNCMDRSPECNQKPVVYEGGSPDVREAAAPDVLEAGTPDVLGCVSPTPIVAENALAAACLAQLKTDCKSALDACAADCDCASFTNGCINGTSPLGPDPTGAVECESGAQGALAGAIFNCMDNPFASSLACKRSQIADAGADH